MADDQGNQFTAAFASIGDEKPWRRSVVRHVVLLNVEEHSNMSQSDLFGAASGTAPQPTVTAEQTAKLRAALPSRPPLLHCWTIRKFRMLSTTSCSQA